MESADPMVDRALRKAREIVEWWEGEMRDDEAPYEHPLVRRIAAALKEGTGAPSPNPERLGAALDRARTP